MSYHQTLEPADSENFVKLLISFFFIVLLIASNSSQAEGIKPAPQVQILVASWCVHCRELEKFLQDQGIAYTSLDIERDATGRKRYQQLGGGGVPMVIIGNSVLKGFDPIAIKEMLSRVQKSISKLVPANPAI